MRYLQLTLRYHESVSSQEDGPREGRGDNQRAGARPRFIVLDLTQVHGLNETASALLGKFNRRCSEAAVVLLFAAVGPMHQPLLRAHGKLVVVGLGLGPH